MQLAKAEIKIKIKIRPRCQVNTMFVISMLLFYKVRQIFSANDITITVQAKL